MSLSSAVASENARTSWWMCLTPCSSAEEAVPARTATRTRSPARKRLPATTTGLGLARTCLGAETVSELACAFENAGAARPPSAADTSAFHFPGAAELRRLVAVAANPLSGYHPRAAARRHGRAVQTGVLGEASQANDRTTSP